MNEEVRITNMVWEWFYRLGVWQKMLLFGGGVLLVFGFLGLAKGFSDEGTKVEIIEATSSGRPQLLKREELVVDVAGEVVSPGVYRLSAESRVGEALAAAGGLSARADREWVAKNINLAGKLADGAKIYVPKVGQKIEGGVTVTTGSTNSPGQVAGVVAGTININTASASELDTLPGIGPVTANKIITNRPYQSIQELLEKKVVSQKVFDQIKDKIGIY